MAQKKWRNSGSLHLKSPLSPCIIMKNLVSCRKEAAMRTDFPSFLLSQTYPREGTETWRNPVGFFHASPRHNLSPRGDGNTKRNSPFTRSNRSQLIPAKGTETWRDAVRLPQHCGHNLSPRGDGNSRRNWRPHTQRGHNLSPRGDGNTLRVGRLFYFICHNLSPRGDGNVKCRKVSHSVAVTTYPREGTET